MAVLLLSLIYLAFISLGLPDSLLGAAWPSMQAVLSVPISYMGYISMIISACTIITSLVSERLTARFGTSRVVVVSVFLTALALYAFSVSRSFWLLCLWSIPFGFGAGAVDAALNNYVALHYQSRHMSWLHCFWGVGTIISPYVMSFALHRGGWQSGYGIISLTQAIIAVILLVSLPLWKIHQSKDAQDEAPRVLGIKGALKIRGVPCLLLGFFCYCAAESTVMHWASSYLVEAKGIDTQTAAAFASLFFIGITAGRFLGGFLPERFGDRKRVCVGSVVALAGCLLILLPIKNALPSLIGLVVIGLGCAPIYPSIIHSTPANFGAENSQAIIGIQMASAYTGCTFLPPVFGLVARYLNIRLFPVFLLALFALMLAMTEKTYQLTALKKEG